MGAAGNTLLRLTDLTVDYASQEGTVHAVDRVSFEIAPGELVGPVGESGGDKSVTASAGIPSAPSAAATSWGRPRRWG